MRWWVRRLIIRWRNRWEDVLHPEVVAAKKLAWERYCKSIQKCPCCGTHFWHIDKAGHVLGLVSVAVCLLCGCEACKECFDRQHMGVHYMNCKIRLERYQ